MAENPFTPSFGTVPLIMAGRDELLDSMRVAFAREGRDPLLSSLLVGARGTGKTALLARIREEASAEGWVSVGAVSPGAAIRGGMTPGFCRSPCGQALSRSLGRRARAQMSARLRDRIVDDFPLTKVGEVDCRESERRAAE